MFEFYQWLHIITYLKPKPTNQETYKIVSWDLYAGKLFAREPRTIVAELKWGKRSDYQSPHHWPGRGDIFNFKNRHPLVMGESALICKCSQKGYIYYEMKAAIIFFLFCNTKQSSPAELILEGRQSPQVISFQPPFPTVSCCVTPLILKDGVFGVG